MPDLLQYMNLLELRNADDRQTILCTIRKKPLILQPEEIVRQLFIHYLVEELDYPKAKIAVEKGISVNGLKRRFDILVYNRKIEPFILVECKSMYVELTQDVVDQVSHYNLPLGVQYLAVTNGKTHAFFSLDKDKNRYISIPVLPIKNQKL